MVKYNTIIEPDPDTAISNIVCLESSTIYDHNPTNNCDNATTILGNYPNIWIEKDGSHNMRLGDTRSYELRFGNNGNQVATDVVIHEHIPTV